MIDREAYHAVRRGGVVERAALEINPATVKRTARVAEFMALANPSWTPAQCRQLAASVEWCGIFALAMLHAEGLGLREPWVCRGFVRRLDPTRTPEPGDVFVGPAPLYHHGIVEARYLVGDKPWLCSIEGNTPGVARRDRPEPRGLTYYSIEPWIDATRGG